MVNQKSEDRNAALDKWMLSRLKYKVLILVNSLLEMRTSDAVVKRIMRSLPFKILKNNIMQIFKRYRAMYGNKYIEECLGHAEGDPKEDKESPEYYELIIETGFYLFFLISSYVEADIQDADIEI